MAAADMINEPHDRQAHRRRPFSTWVKRLTNFKSSSDVADRPKRQIRTKRGPKLNNPYPQSGHIGEDLDHDHRGSSRDCSHTNQLSSYSFTTARTRSITSLERRTAHSSVDGIAPTTLGGRSTAGTTSTENVAQRSLAPSHGGASSLAGTSRTIGCGADGPRGADSTFSSPAPSVRSLTTTLTTIQSVAPVGQTPYVQTPQNGINANPQSIQFSQPFPTATPPSAIPAHLAPASNPTTYTTATANNLLTDNASILTLASSSKRRRRRSMDTDASVRALAPSSIWGGSRESLPLSVLSANIEQAGMPATSGLHGGGSRLGPDRNSIYSAAGVAPAISNERSSMLAKQADGVSVRSGRMGQGRPDSITGSIAGVTSPLATAHEAPEGRIPKEDKGNGAAQPE